MDLKFRCVTGLMTAGVLVGGLTGCGDDAQAGPAEETSAVEEISAAEGAEAPAGGDDEQSDEQDSSDAAEEPEPVPASSEGPAENWPEPELPEDASERTEEGVEAALQHWFETRQYARNTGDTAPLEAASYSNCEFCDHQRELVHEMYENGWVVQEVDVISDIVVVFDDEVANAYFLLDTGSYETYWDGELHDQGDGEEETGWSAALTREGEHWAVADLVYVASDQEVEDVMENAE